MRSQVLFAPACQESEIFGMVRARNSEGDYAGDRCKIEDDEGSDKVLHQEIDHGLWYGARDGLFRKPGER